MTTETTPQHAVLVTVNTPGRRDFQDAIVFTGSWANATAAWDALDEMRRDPQRDMGVAPHEVNSVAVRSTDDPRVKAAKERAWALPSVVRQRAGGLWANVAAGGIRRRNEKRVGELALEALKDEELAGKTLTQLAAIVQERAALEGVTTARWDGWNAVAARVLIAREAGTRRAFFMRRTKGITIRKMAEALSEAEGRRVVLHQTTHALNAPFNRVGV